MLLFISRYQFWKLVVNNKYRPWVALVSSIFPNAINYFSFKIFPGRVIYFSWKNISEWKILELVLLNCYNLVLVTVMWVVIKSTSHHQFWNASEFYLDPYLFFFTSIVSLMMFCARLYCYLIWWYCSQIIMWQTI